MNFTSELYGNVNVVVSKYYDNNLAILLTLDSGAPLARLSVNIPEYADILEEDEFFAKTYSENEKISEEALNSGLFESTYKSIYTNQGLLFPVWKLLKSPSK